MSEDKYKAIMLLHALGDTIGFKNGEWEFNYFKHTVDVRTTLEIIFDFIALGGITGLNLENWNVSDDTLFHMAVCKSLIDDEDDIEVFKKNMINTVLDMQKDEDRKDNEKLTKERLQEIKFRGVGITTITSIENWTKNKANTNIKSSGGNGVAMRSLCIGAYYHRKEDLDRLIKFSIETGKLTHLSPIGFLGGFSSAYFVHLALNKVPLEKFPYLLLELCESDKILKYIPNDSHESIIAYRRFISLWKKYLELRFKDGKPIKSRVHKNLIFRTKFFNDFTTNYDEFYLESKQDEKPYLTIGGSGVTAMLMAYDALIDAEDSWEKLVYYSMLHVGDSDTIGAIAGGIYGALYGFKNVPERLLEHIEKKEDIEELAKKLYEKSN